MEVGLLNESKKPARVRQNSDGTDFEKSFQQEQYSIEQKGKQRIEELLSYGSKNAKTADDLLKLTDIPNIRELHRQIANERLNGALILSKKGYFLPADGNQGNEELRTFIKARRRMALSLLFTLQTAKKELARREADEQLVIGETPDE